ncbi:DUF1902 domain-containing protein [Agrobacterium larrymoorei]|uniref:DUF1902 domain-containing protein n=1 Tax=Agrobacterium larrymoorei TaxID=160699 RepID=UPI001572B180|nr:DUF1902 domain-containing protein [Agrobacterium larrymoorei]NTJ42127.1 DUF1902 domain-containing protein [Agrobacterium larrymoorei]
MKTACILVRVLWDEHAAVWVASSHDIDGMAVEAETVELLESRVLAAISDLHDLNGVECASRGLPVHFREDNTVKEHHFTP